MNQTVIWSHLCILTLQFLWREWWTWQKFEVVETKCSSGLRFIPKSSFCTSLMCFVMPPWCTALQLLHSPHYINDHPLLLIPEKKSINHMTVFRQFNSELCLPPGEGSTPFVWVFSLQSVTKAVSLLCANSYIEVAEKVIGWLFRSCLISRRFYTFENPSLFNFVLARGSRRLCREPLAGFSVQSEKQWQRFFMEKKK